MSEKHFVVSLHKGVDKDQFLNELNSNTSLENIPDRKVDNVNTRPISKRMLEVAITQEEADELLKDSRVGGVNEPLVWDEEWLDYEQEGTFIRNSSSTSRDNWGFRRHISETNEWGASTGSDIGGTYPYHLDGSGIDYVHQESKFRFDHQEWQDANGVSRLQQFQWNTLPNCSSISNIDYTNSSGSNYHATHCAGTAVGKTYGWAKNANIFCLDMGAVNSSYWFDAIKEFHKAKTVNPLTGFKRPTVVSASWGYKSYFQNITDIYFRGSSVGSVKSSNYGMIGDGSNRFNANLYNLNAEVEEMQDEGVHYHKSAGNQYQKLCYPGDIDYNNYITRSVNSGGISAGNPIYYNRGAGNIGPDTIVCGNLDSALYSNSEACNTSSDKGPRVDVYAAGTNIVSAYNSSSSAIYNLSGTSMSTPNVAGMSCLVLQLNPGYTPAQLREWWHKNSLKGQMYQGPTDENTPSTFFANNRNLMSPDATSNRIAYLGNLNKSKTFGKKKGLDTTGPTGFKMSGN
tara:strand:- start:276 stop:1817 length:1542 start_codon:yes stop_codon:yes gene_type:complete